MKIAIYGQYFQEAFNEAIYKIFEILNKKKITIIVYKPFFKYIKKRLFFAPNVQGFFTNYNDLPKNIDIIFSVGGDGTFLECVSIIKKSNIPILGINSGRLGFLASISKLDVESAINQVIKKEYTIERRSLIQLITKNNFFGNFNYGLNELTVQKKDTSSMIAIDVYLNKEFLNKYWADGLIIATPTGSTAYSLSAGGPIIVPGSENFVITPIAPHNLTVRPIVVPDNNILTLKISGRDKNYLAALDFRSQVFPYETEITVKKADFYVKMIKLK